MQPELLEQLRTDVPAWNAHRAAAPEWCPDLEGVDLTDVDLTKANLKHVTGLIPEQLAGAVLTGAQLPEDFDFDLKVAEDAAKHARTLMIALLLGCAYCILTVGATTDVSLVLNSATSELPMIRAKIPIVGFYYGAPLLIAGFYVFFHLSLLHLWQLLAKKPAVFPDGTPLDEKVFPWLLTDLIRTTFPLLDPSEVSFARLRTVAGATIAWLAVPTTLLAMGTRCLARHDDLLSGFQFVLLTLTSMAALSFWHRMRATLSRQPWANAAAPVAMGSMILLFGGLLWAFITSNPNRNHIPLFDADLTALEAPKDWLGTDEELAKFKGLDLEGWDGQYTEMGGAFLVRANLKEAILNNADLKEASLHNANLYKVQLSNADLYWAQLPNANLLMSQLNNTDLRMAELNNVILYKAHLHAANLSDSQLRRAILSDTDLLGSNLSFADMSGADLRRANLTGTKLYQTNLSGANLTRAKLQGADLEGANLHGAELDGAQLQGSLNLSISQVHDACISSETILPLAAWLETEGEDAVKVFLAGLSLIDPDPLAELTVPHIPTMKRGAKFRIKWDPE